MCFFGVLGPPYYTYLYYYYIYIYIYQDRQGLATLPSQGRQGRQVLCGALDFNTWRSWLQFPQILNTGGN